MSEIVAVLVQGNEENLLLSVSLGAEDLDEILSGEGDLDQNFRRLPEIFREDPEPILFSVPFDQSRKRVNVWKNEFGDLDILEEAQKRGNVVTIWYAVPTVHNIEHVRLEIRDRQIWDNLRNRYLRR